MLLLKSIWPGSLLIRLVAANVEKTIFLGPEPVTIPTQKPTLSDLRLDTLTPDEAWSLRTYIPAQFATDSKPQGEAYWAILDSLVPGQRYEVRVCWAATQPTAFTLDAFPLQTVFDNPELISSLSDFSYARHAATSSSSSSSSTRSTDTKVAHNSERPASLLLLRILAAADYFSSNATLMQKVPPVYADIILDPYLFNILPRSLVPTVGVLLIVAVVAWLLASRVIVPWLRAVVADGLEQKEREQRTGAKKKQ